MKKPASPLARPAALEAGGQGEATGEHGCATARRSAKDDSVIDSAREESDAAAIARAPGARKSPSRERLGGRRAENESRAARQGQLGRRPERPTTPAPSLPRWSVRPSRRERRIPRPRAAGAREGLVRLKLRVSGDGRLIAAKIAASSGSTLLDRAALDLAFSVFPLDNIARRELDLVLAVRYSLSE